MTAPAPTPLTPLWDAKRMGEACKRNAERRERMRPKPSFDTIIKFAYEATLAEMRDEYEADRQRLTDEAAAKDRRIGELEQALQEES